MMMMMMKEHYIYLLIDILDNRAVIKNNGYPLAIFTHEIMKKFERRSKKERTT